MSGVGVGVMAVVVWVMAAVLAPSSAHISTVPQAHTQQGQVSRCRGIPCNSTCSLVRGSDGCPQCDCTKPCKDVECQCPPCKKIRGRNGCPLCLCHHLDDHPLPWCPQAPLECDSDCVGMDEFGCQSCMCGRQCGDTECAVGCGMVLDAYGCAQCDCPPPCPPAPPCLDNCNRTKDIMGCERCYCPCPEDENKNNKDGVTCTVCGCHNKQLPCPLGCETRVVTDEKGCKKCSALSSKECLIMHYSSPANWCAHSLRIHPDTSSGPMTCLGFSFSIIRIISVSWRMICTITFSLHRHEDSLLSVVCDCVQAGRNVKCG